MFFFIKFTKRFNTVKQLSQSNQRYKYYHKKLNKLMFTKCTENIDPFWF